MFELGKKDSEAAQAAARQAESAGSSQAGAAAGARRSGSGQFAVIGRSIQINGDVKGDEDLMIEGDVSGTVELRNHALTIGKEGKVKADIFARAITVDGTTDGDLFASERISIRASANVRGNMLAPRVSLEEGARFKGSIEMDQQAVEKVLGSSAGKPAVRSDSAATKPNGDAKPADAKPVAAGAGSLGTGRLGSADLRGAAAAGPTPGRGTGATKVAFKAPLLTRILEGPESERRLIALDFGAPCQSLIDRLAARQPCRIEIADFVANGGIESLKLAEPETLDARLGKLLPAPNHERLNLILCWDMPNYLPLPALTRLFALLGARAAPACRLHMLISYSRRDMPVAPGRYLPVDDGQLAQICASAERAQAPRYSPEDLGKALSGFRYERGVLLANGMQEFVYAWPGAQPGIDADRSTAARPAAAPRAGRPAPASPPAAAATRSPGRRRG